MLPSVLERQAEVTLEISAFVLKAMGRHEVFRDIKGCQIFISKVELAAVWQRLELGTDVGKNGCRKNLLVNSTT